MKRQQGKGKARQSKQSQRKVHSLTAIPTSYASTATVGGEGAQAQSQSQTQTHWRDRKHQQEQDQEQLEKELELRPEEEYKYDDDNAKGPSSSKRFPPTVVKPGDEVTEIVAEWTTNIKIGEELLDASSCQRTSKVKQSDCHESHMFYFPLFWIWPGFGLQSDGDTVTVTVPGLLRLQKPNKFYVDASHRRVRKNLLFMGIRAKQALKPGPTISFICSIFLLRKTQSLPRSQTEHQKPIKYT